ncbi:MAG TPA: LpxI family protein [Candidatus Melainabacteria bacterium]|jgi:UDP-2,3-diacylglucosamine hydrolase|nr:LpxI family protein [Candidatus Melainabacteria bacterium]HIN65247.1 LpxI family protein [Candidatus Obscuribacterales bacterium]
MLSSLTQKEQKETDGRRILGIIAGDGKLPPMLAQSAREKGYKVVSLALTDDALARMQPLCDAILHSPPGLLSRNISYLKNQGVQDVVFIGKLNKVQLLRNILKIDLTAIKEMSKLANLNDGSIQTAVGGFMESHGMRVVTQSEFLPQLFPSVGVMTKKQPTAAEYVDIEYGYKIAKELARMEIGQTVVVRDRMIIAIEAIEGTDEAIKRGVQLADGPVVVVKVARPVQDQRFDIPAAGMRTLNAMLSKKPGGILAVAAGEVMMVEKEEMIAFADEHQISIVAVSGE